MWDWGVVELFWEAYGVGPRIPVPRGTLVVGVPVPYASPGSMSQAEEAPTQVEIQIAVERP